ncbi:L-ascorbate metabolism protein UlaG, beta-lactamase superfamily [Palleronia marisminoris]|uniref:Metal-dependent hydrolase n=1 Tax=Palleronia marisminoris TaxID=315423 RepID=A0A1Y5RSA5_9RHOB|nr:MBL fold metallo-hydrolase [Palleronia marisminoris]SFG51478.1 L-ascorbate metabolism protein UlaG, beta-lactamase superfamily [Palleronia marisminoris]SLN24294.1 metal-dependent hydrolase [Palleronia marisminoris]
MTTRRSFLATGATLGAMTCLPLAAFAQDAGTQDGGARTFETEAGPLTVHPISHASLVMETPSGVIYVDPVGGASNYEGLPEPDLILVTHEHGDHYDAETLQALAVGKTQLLTNPAVYDMLPAELQAKAQQVGNGETIDVSGLMIEAVPAYNITEGRQDFHPEGRDNGYVFEIGGRRIYISGDTEGTDEMRALEDIFLAFVSMNLPFTMDVEQAADAIAAFAPTYVYPYHYRGRDGGTQDPQELVDLLAETDAETEVLVGDWYEPGEL